MAWPNDSSPFQVVPTPGTTLLAGKHTLVHQQISASIQELAAIYRAVATGSTPSVPLYWTQGPLFLIGDSYNDQFGNFSYLNSGVVTVSGFYGFAGYLARLARQSGCLVGRYTPAGGVADSSNPALLAGRNYCVSGAGWNSNVNGSYPTALQQISKLLTDYPTLPANSVVFICLTGINDIASQSAVGWQWTSPYNATWTISGAQTVPNSPATMTINVASSTGAVVGATNQIAIPYGTLGAGTYLILNPVTGVGAGTISFLQNQPAWNGLVLPNNGVITTQAQNDIVTELNLVPAQINALIAAGASTVIVTSPFYVSYTPAYTSVGSLAQATTQMYLAQIQSIVAPNSAVGVRLYDMQPYFSDLISNPTKYGFKDATTQWNNSVSLNPNDLVWYDTLHQNYSSYKGIVYNDLLRKFHSWGLVEYVL